MRYVKELERVVSELEDQGASRSNRQRQKYLKKSAQELTAAACRSNPARAINELADQYEKGAKSAVDAGLLMQACRALGQGKDPAPIMLLPGSL
jgi:hypothetical protein